MIVYILRRIHGTVQYILIILDRPWPEKRPIREITVLRTAVGTTYTNNGVNLLPPTRTGSGNHLIATWPGRPAGVRYDGRGPFC